MTFNQISLTITIVLAIIWISLLVFQMRKRRSAADADTNENLSFLDRVLRFGNHLFKSFYKVSPGKTDLRINARYQYLKAKREAREEAEREEREKKQQDAE